MSQSSFFSTSNMPIKPQASRGVRKDPDHTRAAADFQIQTLQRIGRTDPHAMRLRIVQVAQHVFDAGLEDLHRFGEARLKLPHQIGRLGFGALLVPLHEHRLHRFTHLGLAALGHMHQHVAIKVHLAALPFHLQHLAHRGFQSRVRVRDHQLHAAAARAPSGS